jgi:sodium pump decarboxylase gamma subunit
MLDLTIAAIDLHPSFGQQLSFILLGFVMVLLVLAILWGICALLGTFFKKRPSAKPRSASAIPKMQGTAAAMEDTGEDARIVAVVSAAVYATLGTHHKIISIRPSGDRQAWSAEGRRSIFQSHHIR